MRMGNGGTVWVDELVANEWRVAKGFAMVEWIGLIFLRC